MTVRRTLVALFVGIVLAVTPMTAFAAGRPAGMTPGAYSALMAQSRALNARYGNAVTRLSPQDFTELYRDGGSRLSPAALNALVVRSEGLNGLAARSVSTSAQASTVAASFAWDDFGIGMAAAFGLVLLTGGFAVAVRTGTRRRVSVSP